MKGQSKDQPNSQLKVHHTTKDLQKKEQQIKDQSNVHKKELKHQLKEEQKKSS